MKNLKLRQSAEKILPEQLEIFKSEFDLTLPKSYEDFILENNGGYSKLSTYGNPYDGGFEITAFARINLINESILDVLEKDEVFSSRFIIQNHQINEKNIAANFYPFGIDGGGSFYCINMDDYSIRKIYLDNSTESKFVTDSFENFINGLEDPSIYDVD